MEDDHHHSARSCIVELGIEVAALAELIGDQQLVQVATTLAAEAGRAIGFTPAIITHMRSSAANDLKARWGSLTSAGRKRYAKRVIQGLRRSA
jgi:hypothetical protein